MTSCLYIGRIVYKHSLYSNNTIKNGSETIDYYILYARRPKIIKKIGPGKETCNSDSYKYNLEQPEIMDSCFHRNDTVSYS
jgi:hypothetical protein